MEGNGRHAGARKLVCAPAASIIKTMISGLALTRDCLANVPHSARVKHEHVQDHNTSNTVYFFVVE